MHTRWIMAAGAALSLGLTFGAASSAFAAGFPDLATGSTGDQVAVVQQQLADLGYAAGPADGVYSAATTSAVRAFQSRNHIAVDGIAGPVTEKTLVRDLTNVYMPISGSLGQHLLSLGDYGPAVVTLQGDLTQLGYDPGPADGVFNRQTGSAVLLFQAHAGIAVDEVVGPQTYQALLAAMGLSSPKTLPAAPVSPAPAPAAAPSPASTAPGMVLGYYTQYTPQSVTSQNSLAANLNAVNTIAPLWYTVHADGSLGRMGYQRASVRAYARAHHITVLPLVTNAGGNSAILTNSAVRSQVVSQLTQLAVTDGYQGYNIDFEGLSASARNGLNAFVEELSAALDPLGKEVTIAVIPRTATDPYGRAYDYAVLGQYASKVVLMTYDYHDIGSAPGPVAPIGWVTDVVNYALARIPASKIVLGLAAYGYDWSSTGSTVEVHDEQAVNLAAQYGVPITWNAADDEATFQYTSANGAQHTVWVENGYSDAFKLELAKKDHLGGVAIWRLGDEDPELWTAINTIWYGH